MVVVVVVLDLPGDPVLEAGDGHLPQALDLR